MEKRLVKSFFDSCYFARRITDMLGEPSSEIRRHHIYVIDAIHTIEREHGRARVDEVAAYLGIACATAGEYVNELVRKNLVKKLPRDHRHVCVALTERGAECHDKYIEKYYEKIMGVFGGINNNDMAVTVRTIRQAYYLLSSEYERRV